MPKRRPFSLTEAPKPAAAAKRAKNHISDRECAKSAAGDVHQKNRFKYKTFNERLEGISIDSFRRLTGFHGLCPDDSSCWLLEAMEAWRDLNYTAHFRQVLQRLDQLAISLPAIIFHKKEIAAVLADALEPAGKPRPSGLVQPVCNLIAMLAKDLGAECYEYFGLLFTRVSLALSESTEVADIESSFSCLVYLLKEMRGPVLSDINSVVSTLFNSLFGKSKRPHIKRLACFCYSYLIRQSGDLLAVDALLDHCTSNECIVDSICLGVLDSETARPKDLFAPVLKRCIERSHDQALLNSLLCKLSERISNTDMLFAILSDCDAHVSEDTIIHCLVHGKFLDPISVYEAIECRSPSHPIILSAFISKLDLEGTLKVRCRLAQSLGSLDNDSLSTCLLMLSDLGWSHFKPLFSAILDARPNIGGRLLGSLALLRLSGADLDYQRIDAAYDPEYPEASLEILSSPSSRLDAASLHHPKRIEFLVVFISQLLRKGFAIDPNLVQGSMGHPLVFCNLPRDFGVPSDQLLFFLTCSNQMIASHSLSLLAEMYRESKVFEQCRKVLSIPVALDSYRDRIRELRQLEALCDASLQPEDAKLAINFLLGSVHVNLTLLWPETFRILSLFASKYPSVFACQFDRAFEYAVDAQRDAEVYDLPNTCDVSDFVCTRKAVLSKLESSESLRSYLCRTVLRSDRYSILDSSCIAVWAKMLASHASLAENGQRQLQFLLEVIVGKKGSHQSLLRTAQSSLPAILRACSIIGNYGASYREFFDSCALRFLASGDSQNQHDALSLIISTRRSTLQTEFAIELRALLDGKSSRDQLVSITNDIGKWMSSPSWEKHLLPVIIRVLYGMMITRRKVGGSGRNNMDQRRKMILSSIASWPPECGALEYFVGFLAEPSDDPSKMAGLLGMLGPLFSYTGRKLLQSSFDYLMSAVLRILEYCESADNPSNVKKLRSLCCKHLVTALSKAGDRTVSEDLLTKIFKLAIEPRLEKFEAEQTQSHSAMLSLLIFLADSEFSSVINEQVMCRITSSIASAHVKDDVLKELLLIPIGLIGRGRISIFNIQLLIDSVCKKTLCNDSSTAGKEIFFRGCKIMQELATFVTSSADAEKLLTMALDILHTGRLPEPMLLQIVVLIARLFPKASVDGIFVGKLVSVLSELLSRGSREICSAAADVFSLLDNDTPEWNSRLVSSYVVDLVSWSTEILDQPDYDRRSNVLSQLRKLAPGDLTLTQWMPVVHALLSYLQDPEEIALRNQASGIIEKVIAMVDFSWISTVVLPVVTRNMRCKIEAVRFEFFLILGKIVERTVGDDVGAGKDLDRLQALRPLLALGKEESNVFVCFCHLQTHRRARAIRNIVEFAKDSLSQIFDHSLYTDCILPMVLKYCLFNADAGDSVPAPLVNMEAVKTAGWLCGQLLPWNAYYKRIKSLVKSIKAPTYPGSEKQAVKLLPELLKGCSSANLSGHEDDLKSQALPLLFEAMRGSSASAAPVSHISIAVAIGELLSRLSDAAAMSQLPKLYSALAQTLRSRLEDERQDARATLTKLLELFPQTAPLLLKELCGYLTRGYQRHVLAYTLYSVIDCPRLTSTSDVFLTSKAMDLVIEDTLGTLATEREAEEWSGKLKEARNCKSFSTISALVKKSPNTAFILQHILVPLLRTPKAQAARGEKVMGKLLESISSSLSGFSCVDLILLAHDLVDPSSTFYENQQGGNVECFVYFGIRLAGQAVKRDAGRSRDILAPHLEKLARIAVNIHWLNNVNSSFITLAAIKLVCSLLNQYFSGLPVFSDASITKSLLSSAFELIIRSTSSLQSELISACFKFISTVLKTTAAERDNKANVVDLTEGQVRALLQYTSANLERIDSQQLTFSLIKAMLARKIVCAELYTLMSEGIRERIVVSGALSTRQHCLQSFLQFINGYSMTEKRLKEHIAFFMRNLEYSGDGGRMAALSGLEGTLKALSKRQESPDDILAEQVVKALVLRMVNEESATIRAEVQRTACDTVIPMLSMKCIERIMVLGKKWLSSETKAIQRACIQLVSLLLSASVTQVNGLAKLVMSRISQLSSPDDVTDENALLIADALQMLGRVSELEYEVVSDLVVDKLMLFPNLVIRRHVNQLLLSLSETSDDKKMVKNALLQIEELMDVHGTDVADLSVQLLLRAESVHCDKMERLIKNAGHSQFVAHIGSAFKYFGGLVAQKSSLLTARDFAVIVRSCLRVSTNQSLAYPEDLKQLAQQVQDLLKSVMPGGEGGYETVVGGILAERADARAQRRTHLKQLAVSDPQAAAKLRLRHRLKKKRSAARRKYSE